MKSMVMGPITWLRAPEADLVQTQAPEPTRMVTPEATVMATLGIGILRDECAQSNRDLMAWMSTAWILAPAARVLTLQRLRGTDQPTRIPSQTGPWHQSVAATHQTRGIAG